MVISGLNSKPPGTPVLPQTLSASHPNAVVRPRAQSGGPIGSTDPILSLIQHKPTIVMNPASPAPYMAAILTSQQSAVPNTARVPSPLSMSCDNISVISSILFSLQNVLIPLLWEQVIELWCQGQ